MTVDDDESINFSERLNDAFTIQAWINADTAGGSNAGRVFTKGSANYLGITSGSTGQTADLVASIDLSGSDATVTADDVITYGTWHHVALTYSDDGDDEVTLYVDGKQVGASTGGSGSPPTESQNLVIGGSSSSNYFDGYIDEFKIYAEERTAAEIASDVLRYTLTLYGATASFASASSSLPTPTAYYKFDEGYGTTLYDSITASTYSLTISSPSGSSFNVDAKFGKAFHPNGIRMASFSFDNFSPGQQSFTLALWFKSTSSSNPVQNEYLIAEGEIETDADGYAIYAGTSGQIYFRTADNLSKHDSLSSPTDLYDSQWHHVTAVKTSTTKIDLYVDGVLVHTKTPLSAWGTLNGMNPFTVGALPTGTNIFNGAIDDAYVFISTALTPAQVKILASGGYTSRWGSLGTDTSGSSPSNSYSSEFCIPGDTSTCSPPVAYWNMNENTGTLVQDSGGCRVNLSAPSNDSAQFPAWNNGKFGSALLFDGTNDGAYSTANSTCIQPENNMTIEAWIKPHALPSTYGADMLIVGEAETASPYYSWLLSIPYASANQNGAAFLWSSSSPASYYYAYSKDTTGVELQTNSWQHIAGVRSGPSLKVFINGQDVTATADTPGSTATIYHATTKRLLIGKSGSTDNLYSGYIDDIKLYDYNRSHEQINWDYNKMAPLYHYKFDECSGNTAYNSATNSNGDAAGSNLTIYPVSSGNTSVGTCGGSANQMRYGGASGKFGASLDFDGTDDFLSAPSATLIKPVSSPSYKNVSFGAWVNPATTPTSDTIIHKNNEFRLTTNSSGYPQCEIYSGSWQTAANDTTALPTSTWSHVLCTYDGENIKIYVNGVLKDTQPETDVITSLATTALNIGRDSAGSGYFDGKIDEVTIYGAALNSYLAKNLVNQGAAVNFGNN